MTKHERAVRDALKAFEPKVPPHTMTAITKVIEDYLKDVTHFSVMKTCKKCGHKWDAAIWGDDFKCIRCHPLQILPRHLSKRVNK